jgi:hypothetical protein
MRFSVHISISYSRVLSQRAVPSGQVVLSYSSSYKQPISCTADQGSTGKDRLQFNHLLYIVYVFTRTYIVSFFLRNSYFTIVPDDDPRKGSKHVGLAYRDCMI